MKTFRHFILIVILFFIYIATSVAQIFEHPGIFNREDDFARMRQKIAEKAEPWYSTWNNLLSSPEAQIGWAGPRAVATVIRGGTGDNISLMYRDVAAAYQNALIYKISGDKSHGDKAVAILNAWASINTLVSGNADRYLAAGLNGYQFANAAEMMRGYPGFDFEKFKNYLLNVFFFPMNERFLIGNAWGAPHNDACATNYRVNWDICNMNAMLGISILADHKTGFDEALNYLKSGDGTGQIGRAVPFLHPNYPIAGSNIIGQWEESGRDQGHAVGGLSLYGLFCEIAWNQGVDIYSYDNFRFRKGAEYVARYNLGDSVAGSWKYDDLPYTSYSRMMGSNCSWYTEPVLGSATRGKNGASWELIFNHYARRLNQGNKVIGLYEMLQQQQGWSRSWPTLNVHADTYDTPGGGGLTFAADSGSYILPWRTMDVSARSIAKLNYYGNTTLKDSTLSVTGSGAGVKGNVDQFRFTFQKLVDDGYIETQISSLDEVNASCQAGIMMRESLEQNSANIFLSLSTSQGMVLGSRDSTGLTANIISTQAAINTLPYWLRIVRTGNNFTAYISADRQNWTETGSKLVKMNRLIYAGLAVSAKTTLSVTTAVFEKTKINQGNIRPVVKINTPVAGKITYVTPANISISGTAYDLDGLLDRAEIFVNGNLVSTVKTSPFTFNLTNQTEGNYSIYIKAYDKTGAISATDTVKVTVNPVTSKLPWYKCDETKTAYFTADANGNSLIGILYGGATFTPGKINNSVRLDGVDDYIKVPNGIIEKLSDFTISSWVYADTIAAWSRIFDFGSNTSYNMFLSVSEGSGKLKFSLSGVNNVSQAVTASGTLPVKTWSFVTVTLTGNKLCIFLNGKLVGSSLTFTNRPYDLGTTTANYIGKSQYAADPYFRGNIDDFRIYNYAMSVDEVLASMAMTPVEEVKYNPVMFYPNPAKGQICFENAENAEVKIYDSMGRILIQSQIHSSKELIDINGLPQGIYIVKTTDQNNIQHVNKLTVR